MPKHIDDVYIQRRAISFIACDLGEEMVYTMRGSKRRTRLSSVLIAAKNAVCPTVHERTIREWWHYFLEFGYTPADARKERKKSRKKRKRYNTNWTDDTVVATAVVVSCFALLLLVLIANNDDDDDDNNE